MKTLFPGPIGILILILSAGVPTVDVHAEPPSLTTQMNLAGRFGHVTPDEGISRRFSIPQAEAEFILDDNL